MNQNVKNLLLFVVVVVSVVLLWNWVTTSRAGTKEIAFSEFLDRIEKNQITEVLIRGDEVYGRSSETPASRSLAPRPYDFVTYSPGYDKLVGVLREHNVKIKAEQPSQGSIWSTLLTWWLPIVLMVGMWFYLYRQMQAGGTRRRRSASQGHVCSTRRRRV